VRWFVGGADLANERVASAVVGQVGEHAHSRDSVGNTVMEFHQDRPPAVGETFDDPAFPQRAIPIETPLHHVGNQPEQRAVVTRMRNRRTPHMVQDVEVGGVDPFRCAEVKRMRAHHLLEPRDRK
jgi:hypothetical protein